MLYCLTTEKNSTQEKPIFLFEAFTTIITAYDTTFANSELDHINIAQFLNECEFTYAEENTRQTYSSYLKADDKDEVKNNQGIKYMNLKRRLDDLYLVDKIMTLFALMSMHLYTTKNPLTDFRPDSDKRALYGGNFFYVNDMESNCIPKKTIMKKLDPIINQMNNFFMEMLAYKHDIKSIQNVMSQEKKVDEAENPGQFNTNINIDGPLHKKTKKTKKTKK
jgi:hypothetical protein